MSKTEVIRRLKKGLIFLEQYGLSDLAWKRADALEVLKALMTDEIGVLGGDVYRIVPPGRFEPIYYDWTCKPQPCESAEQFHRRSKIESIEHIQECHDEDEESLVFSITFNERLF